MDIKVYADLLSEFFGERWKQEMPSDYAGPPMVFIVGGYDAGAAYGKVFLFEIPNSPTPREQIRGLSNFMVMRLRGHIGEFLGPTQRILTRPG